MIIMPKPDRNFTIIQNDIFNNYPGMSAKAKFMLLQILSKPDDWKFNLSWLANQNSEGIHAAKSSVKEWGANNFHHRFVIRENGRIKEVENVFCLPPMSREEAETCFLNRYKESDSIEQAIDMVESATDDITVSEDATIICQQETFQQEINQQETCPIINTDTKQILKETTTTHEPVPVQEPVQVAKTMSSSSNIILNLIPVQHRSPAVLTLVNKAMVDCHENDLKKAILYSASNVKGGSLQFRAYLDKTIKNKWADGWEPANEKLADRQAAGEQIKHLPISSLKMLAEVGNLVAIEALKRRGFVIGVANA